MKIIVKENDNHYEIRYNRIVFSEFVETGFYYMKNVHYIQKTDPKFDLFKKIIEDRNVALLNVKHEDELISKTSAAKVIDDLIVRYK